MGYYVLLQHLPLSHACPEARYGLHGYKYNSPWTDGQGTLNEAIGRTVPYDKLSQAKAFARTKILACLGVWILTVNADGVVSRESFGRADGQFPK